MTIIYHVTTENEWAEAQQQGWYAAPSLELEGFIHCSTDEQVAGVLERYFKGKGTLVKLVIDTEKLTAPLQFDLAPSINEEFPHIYGRLNLDAIVEAQKIGVY